MSSAYAPEGFEVSLCKRWDVADGFTYNAYLRDGGYGVPAQSAEDAAGRGDRHGQEERSARPRGRWFPSRSQMELCA